MQQERSDGTAGAEHGSRLLEIINSSWQTQVVHVAAELRLAELLANGPKTATQLAEAAGAHAPALHRLLRAMSTLDLCREQENGAFELTPLGTLLTGDHPQSLRCWALWWGQHLWPVWGNLLYSVRTGRSARALLTGTTGFAHLERDPEAAAIFNRALVELTRLACKHIVRAYDFSSLGRVVDVGGGYGELLAAILHANSTARGILFDLPHALEGARAHFQQAGLTERCEFLSGNFFEEVPAGATAYLLKSVLHDWDDERCRQILGCCRRALRPEARLLVIEQVLPQRLDSSPSHQALARSDLNMLVAHAAGERTQAEFDQLLHSAGFAIARIAPAGATWSVIEAVARQ
ncbi:MAG: methyltransferase domain-containing protein [Planctomycetia bacterium]|nr:methyltransferase domain-containing protein [Planctomycetia bacterium]